jgi:MoaA/NifB/PqqE/SkfB family radical SAM enzyme
MCNIWKMPTEHEMDLTEWQQTMHDPIFRKILYLSIAGGEPTLHPNIGPLMELLVESLPQLQWLSLVTHGFHTERVISMTKKAVDVTRRKGVKLSITVSLDGTGAVHNEMRGIPNAFAKTSTTILRLRELQNDHAFRLGAAGVVCNKNLHQIKDAKIWCESIGVPFQFQLVGFHDTYVQNLDRRDELDFAHEDRTALLSLLGELASERDWRKPRSVFKAYYWKDMLDMYERGTTRTTPCPFASDAFVIDGLGDVYYCLSEAKIGNHRGSRTVSEIYYDPRNLELRKGRTETVCRDCNSGCFVAPGLAKSPTKFVWHLLTGKTGASGVD